MWIVICLDSLCLNWEGIWIFCACLCGLVEKYKLFETAPNHIPSYISISTCATYMYHGITISITDSPLDDCQ